ncbi:Asparaginyl-tRNA synthase (glutamine-hydrolyzing) [Lentibacillus sp. JNUCC-1]|uniref:amidase n=1 Tax=Lentibacillus sp. JNUCC-1 TaxID=2654513 RepID=UPI0012E875A4|nr:amidase [Lentibacillus sp. JNUCC-1]MUV37119.1 Asparaginyl-tRNA synthase (glutamine-hydrolyzing) [Lentibacillus sp. JNUCC-1]
MKNDLVVKPVEELAPLIKEKSVSPVELTKAVLDQAEACEEKLNATISSYREEAETAAKQAESEIANGTYRGMYHGIPMGIKDNIFMKDKLTTMASKIHQDFIAPYDAGVISKLKEAGAILTGKLNMHEYAMGLTSDNPHYGAVHNPWELSKIPGGSSGGSGAAIAAHASMASIGTDTAGSIRIPAAFCGIVGLKPTYGRVSTHGVYPLSWTHDHVGPMAKTVKDTAGLFNIIAGKGDGNPADSNRVLDGDVKNLVIGVEEDFYFNQIDNRIDALVRKTINTLVEQGARVEVVSIPSMSETGHAGFTITLSEGSAVHMNNVLERAGDFGADNRGMLEMGAFPSSQAYADALKVREQVKKEFRDTFKKVDVLITPTSPVMPINIGDSQADLNGEKVDFLTNVIRLTIPGNLTGLPSLSVPCGLIDGMPCGIQITGPEFREDLVLNTGLAIEQTNPLNGAKPSIL